MTGQATSLPHKWNPKAHSTRFMHAFLSWLWIHLDVVHLSVQKCIVNKTLQRDTISGNKTQVSFSSEIKFYERQSPLFFYDLLSRTIIHCTSPPRDHETSFNKLFWRPTFLWVHVPYIKLRLVDSSVKCFLICSVCTSPRYRRATRSGKSRFRALVIWKKNVRSTKTFEHRQFVYLHVLF